MELKELERLVSLASSREKLDSSFKNWRSKYLDSLRTQIKNASSAEEKKQLGIKLQTLSESAQKLYDSKKLEFSPWKEKFVTERQGVKQEEKKINYSSNNLLFSVIKKVFQFIRQYNLKYYEESEIVSVVENFDNLLIDEKHPARNESDTFFLKKVGEIKNLGSNSSKELQEKKDLMLRTHTTTSTLKLLKKYANQEFLGASLGSVYRKEDNNSTHLSQFTQLDLVWVARELGLSELENLITLLLKKLFFSTSSELNSADNLIDFSSKEKEQFRYRLRPSYFPFTSPSFEVDLECRCQALYRDNSLKNDYLEKVSEECQICKGVGWVELLGCGFLRQEILERTHKGFTALALGLGIERIAMILNAIEDIREFYRNRLDKLVTSLDAT